jgi:hypothetical protein
MSDTSQGPGWWQANDGRWYPPQQPPGGVQTATLPEPGGADHAMGPGWWQASDGRWYPPEALGVGVPPPKKPLHRRVWFWLLVIVAVGFSGCAAIGTALGVAVDHVAHEKHTIVYSVIGTSSVNNISYNTLQEGNGQNGDVRLVGVGLPWSRTIVASGLITVYNVEATIGPAGGSVTCRITDNGSLVSSQTATGALRSVDCTWGG